MEAFIGFFDSTSLIWRGTTYLRTSLTLPFTRTTPLDGPGTGALDEDEILVVEHAHHDQVGGGVLDVPHEPRHPLALVDAAGGEAAADRAAVPEELVRTVGRRVALHLVHLHDALVTLALGGADHVDDVARLEHLGGANDLADLVLLELLRLEAHLAQVAQGLLDGGLLEVAALGSGHARQLGARVHRDLLEAELDRRVAVLLDRTFADDDAGADGDDGDAQGGPVLVKCLGHSDFTAQKAHLERHGERRFIVPPPRNVNAREKTLTTIPPPAGIEAGLGLGFGHGRFVQPRGLHKRPRASL